MLTFSELLADQNFINDLRSPMSGRNIAAKWGVGKSSVNDWRKKNPLVANSDTVEQSSDGSRAVQGVRDRAVTLADARAWIESSGDNPDLFDISVRSIAYGEGLWSNRMSATPKKGVKAGVPKIDYAQISESIRGFTYVPSQKESLVPLVVVQPTDFQLGKVDFEGGTSETIERVLGSYANVTEYIKEFRPAHVVLANTGDTIENFCSTSSQRDTNDLDLPHQIAAMYELDLQGLKMLSPHTPRLTSAYVPSNHGRWRVGPKADAGDPHADFGITNAKMLKNALESFNVMPNVDILWPESHMESMTVHTDTVNVGLVHGHQAGGPDKMGDWWARQDHGRMPTWDADVLFVGHWHSFRAYQSGDRRMVFVGPANEAGSSWYSNLKGERSTSGMLTVTFMEDKSWRNLQLL